jgi:hypothetical protein
MNNVTKIRTLLSLVHACTVDPLPDGPAHALASGSIQALSDLSLAWYYANLDRRCPLTPAQWAGFQEVRSRN